ncbi:MAG: type IV secretion system DNA-binding domain-containing protein [Candidatus Moranbacteria bacterium]|nr:type IV secretion system DNA-binding domain-containing protein [Candidatus Moranbacteria bacterium]
MVEITVNTVLVPMAWVLGFFCLISGGLLVVKSFFGFKRQVNRSLELDLEVVKVARPREQQNEKGDAWKEELLAMEQLLVALTGLKHPGNFFEKFLYHAPTVILEMANPADSEEIFFLVAIPRVFRESVEKQIHSFFPQAHLERVPDYTIFSPGSHAAIAELELTHSHALPLKTYRNLGVDPMNEISNALSKLDHLEEGAAIQIVLAPAGDSWRHEGRKVARGLQDGKKLKEVHSSSQLQNFGTAVGKGVINSLDPTNSNLASEGEKKPVQLTPQDQDLIKSIEEKAAKGAFRVNLRLLASAATQTRAEQILGQMESAFGQFENPEVNRFRVRKRMKTKDAAYHYIFRNFDDEHAFLLNTEEIAGIFHFPISTTQTPKIKWLKAGAAPPPINVPKEGTLLGFNEYRGVKTDIKIGDKDRLRHLYVIGQTGVGKSNFLQEIAKRDAQAGRGFCFIDPHGDAIEDILACIPKERAQDVIVFDPGDTERTLGMNMLEFDPRYPEQKTFVINEMIGIFDQLYDMKATGGPMFEQYMRNAMLLIMEHPESGSTLMEISRVLADEDFRRMKLAHCANPIVRDFWQNEAEKAGGDAALANMVPYITSKLTPFIANDFMRPIIGQQVSALNFREIMDTKKILLVKLSKGRIGELNARLLGMVVVGKLLMAALSRADIAEDERQEFSLYLDEFQNVTTSSIAQILSEARKYKLTLVLAHQFIGQLKEDISKAVFGNVGSLVTFRVGPDDAEFLEKQFAPVFTAADIVNVDNYQCFARLLMNNELTKPFNMKTFPPTQGSREIAVALKELSRLRYGRDTNLVNQEILDRLKVKG